MESGVRQSPMLPSINFLDIEKIKREEAEHQQRQSAGGTMSAAAMLSPTFPYPGPPPPYSNPPATAPTIPALSGIISPPDSRRTSGDEKETRLPAQQHPSRQSLPSIQEALGAEHPSSYPNVAPTSAPAGHLYPPTSQSLPPSESERRTLIPDSSFQGPSNPFSQAPSSAPRSPFMGHRHPTAPTPQPGHSHRAPLDRGTFTHAQNPNLPALHPLRTDQSPVQQHASQPSSAPFSYSHTSSSFERGPQSAGTSQPPYTYGQYPPPPYAYSAPAPTPLSNPLSTYPPSASFPAQARFPSAWRSDVNELSRVEESKKSGRVGGPAYGESVKRHLDIFDLEASLNEIAEGSGQMLEFTRHYGQRAHQTARSGPSPGSMPTLPEIDNLVKQHARIADSLERIREVIITQQQALAEQAQEKQYQNGYENRADEFQSEGKNDGGFAGADPKKRRGRAAPPGRCHSCNRAETPEWRRGPDGARTLCNACGLHYAKLTRKMGTAKAAQVGSNLRPKDPRSPV